MNGVTPDNDGNITLSASSVGAVGYNTPQSLTDAQKQQARENINAPAPYEAGDNISITGRIITTKAFPCNPNLAANWYFGRPVNQRGQMEYTGSGYMIDRWYADEVVLAISSGAIRVSRSSRGLWYSRIMQNLETDLSKEIAGKTCTLSALVKSVRGIGQVQLSVFNISDNVSTTNIYATLTGGIELVTVTFVVPESYSGKSLGVFFYPDSDDNSRSNGCDVYAVKLELGSQQTLAHQENGKWVLNEIPKFGDQLAECQRYFEWIDVQLTEAFNGSIPYKVVKRTTPVFTYHSVNGTVGKISQYDATGNKWDDVEPSAPPTDLNLRSFALYSPIRNVTRFRVAVSADL